MRLRALLCLPLLCLGLAAQDPALKDTFTQAKALWATAGDREGATSRLDSVVAALAPQALGLSPEWLQMLCESYNWLAVLDDRSTQNKPRAQVRLQALIDLNPDYEVDKALTSQRLATLFERLKGEKFGLVKLSYSPEGGLLLVDGKAQAPIPRKHLPFGPHKLCYLRPGHAPSEMALELAPKDVKEVAFKLTRTASTLTIYTQPSDVEVLLDGKSLGYAIGKGGPEAAAVALPLGLRPEDLSSPYVIPEILPGKHRLEFRAPCFRTRVLELGAEFGTPMADHTLEPVRLDASKGTLSVTSAWPGGELFLSGQSLGPLPVFKAQVCSGPYDLLVRFPGGGFSRHISVDQGKAQELEARPKPRLAFLGLEAGEFTGRTRLQSQLESLGERLEQVAFLAARPGETPKEALARLKASHEAELVLLATPVPDKVIRYVELSLATLDGEEERILLKPLEEDPLGTLAARLNRVPRLTQASLGLSLLDLPGEPGPWVLSASESALKAGIQVGQPLVLANGKPIPSVASLQTEVEATSGTMPLGQGGTILNLPIHQEAMEVPLGSSAFSYPALLAHLRLLYTGSKGDAANQLRLNLALTYMQFRKYDKAVELLRETRISTTVGVSQGTVDFYTGVCFLHLGSTYQAEATQAFRQALKYPQSTLLGPDGPLVGPLAKLALEELK